jgi:hypothetical protein
LSELTDQREERSNMAGPTPGGDLVGYLKSYVEEMAFGEEDPASVVDRYHTPDVVWHTDGLRLDRDRLIAHARPVRRKASSCRLSVHETLTSGNRVAARYTLESVVRGQVIVNEVHMFGELAPDGRLRRIDQITRTPATEEQP